MGLLLCVGVCLGGFAAGRVWWVEWLVGVFDLFGFEDLDLVILLTIICCRLLICGIWLCGVGLVSNCCFGVFRVLMWALVLPGVNCLAFTCAGLRVWCFGLGLW